MKRLNTFVSPFDLARLTELWQQTQEPIFGTTRAMADNACRRVQEARDQFYKDLDSIATSSGLPAPGVDEDGDAIHYGLDFTNGEIVSV